MVEVEGKFEGANLEIFKLRLGASIGRFVCWLDGRLDGLSVEKRINNISADVIQISTKFEI